MTHRNVETFIGRLVTDAGIRRRFAEDPAAVIEHFRREGYELTAVEIDALVAISADAVRSLADAMDRRLRKVHPEPSADLDDG